MKRRVFAGARPGTRALLMAGGVGLLYLLISAAWIFFSDFLAVTLAQSREDLIVIQRYKGIGFVAVMTMVIIWLVYKVYHHGAVLERALLYMQTDPVTGLANRAVAEEFLEARLKHAAQDHVLCGLLLFDIRNLGRVNQSVGRQGGDMLLREVGLGISSLLHGRDLVARLEGDRFLVILASLKNANEILRTGKRIRAAFEQPISIQDVDIQVELRAGAAVAPNHGKTAFELLDAVERALYHGKQTNQPLYLAGREDLYSDAGYLEREAELRRAIRERQFSIVLQPQIDLQTFGVVGAEVLARWHCPGRGQIPPADFISMAESIGLVQEITEQILQLATECAASWHIEEMTAPRLGVNLSSLDLKSGRILATVSAALKRSRLPGSRLTLEITESWLMEDLSLAVGLIHRLRAMGTQIAIDDFGTGYSALSQLIDFPFDYLKFDQSFVSGADHSVRKAQLLAAIQRMASTLGVRTIAEGVENMGELLLLQQAGVNEVQGFLFSRPVTAEQFEVQFLGSGQSPFEEIRQKAESQLKRNHPRISQIGRWQV